MTTMTSTARTLHFGIPNAAAIVAAAAIGVAIGFWADDHGSSAIDRSDAIAAPRQAPAGLPAYEAAKAAQLEQLEYRVQSTAIVAPGRFDLAARKFAQMDAADARYAAAVAPARADISVFKLAQLDAADARYAVAVAPARADVSAFKLAQLDAADARYAVAVAPARADISAFKLAQLDRLDADVVPGGAPVSLIDRKFQQMALEDAR